jgi:hypothetical protein
VPSSTLPVVTAPASIFPVFTADAAMSTVFTSPFTMSSENRDFHQVLESVIATGLVSGLATPVYLHQEGGATRAIAALLKAASPT